MLSADTHRSDSACLAELRSLCFEPFITEFFGDGGRSVSVDGGNRRIAIVRQRVEQTVAVGVGGELVAFDLRADGHHAAVEFGTARIEKSAAGRPFDLIARERELVRGVVADGGDAGHRWTAQERDCPQ